MRRTASRMAGGDLYTALLPAHLAAEAAAEEPNRFASLIATLHGEWRAADGRTDAQRVNDSLKWVAIVNRCGSSDDCGSARCN